VDINGLLGGVRKDAQLSAPDQELRIEAQPGLTVRGWPGMLERAVDNLVRNALRFSPPGQPVEVFAHQQGERIEVSVRDHGPGVASEHLAQLGEPFFRAPGQSAQGHGLGLAIARRAIERHGGRLVLGNHPAGGFVATLELPLTPPTEI
jgi:two-component system OmpR family sensor kinase